MTNLNPKSLRYIVEMIKNGDARVFIKRGKFYVELDV